MRPEALQVARKLALISALAGMLAACGDREKVPSPTGPHPATNAPPVDAAHATSVPRPEALFRPVLPDKVVELQSLTTTPVVSKEAGYLVRQVVTENAFVNAGAALFLIDPKAEGANPRATLLTVASPASGTLGHAFRGAGDWINTGDVLASIGSSDVLVARVEFPREVYDSHKDYFDALGVKALPLPQLEIVVDDAGSYAQKADEVSMTFLPDTHTVRLEAEFANGSHRLSPGQFVRLRPTSAERRRAGLE